METVTSFSDHDPGPSADVLPSDRDEIGELEEVSPLLIVHRSAPPQVIDTSVLLDVDEATVRSFDGLCSPLLPTSTRPLLLPPQRLPPTPHVLDGEAADFQAALSVPESLPAPFAVPPPDRVEGSPFPDLMHGIGAPSHIVQMERTVLGTLVGGSLPLDFQKTNFISPNIAFQADDSIRSQSLLNNNYVENCLTPALIVENSLDSISRDLPNKILDDILPPNVGGVQGLPVGLSNSKDLAILDSSVNADDTVQDGTFIPSEKSLPVPTFSQTVRKVLPDAHYVGPQPVLTLSKECAVFVERLPNTNLDIYCRALERQIGPGHIAYIGRAPGDQDKILAFVGSPGLAEKLVHTGISVRGRWLMVSFRSVPATRIVLSDVMPYVNDDVLVAALASFGEVATPGLRRIRAATSHSSFRKVFSYRREVYMYLSKDSILPSKLNIDSEGEVHEIELSTNGVKCYRCGKFGHSITFCDVPKTIPLLTDRPSMIESSLDTDAILAKQCALRDSKSAGILSSVSSDLPNIFTSDSHSGPSRGDISIVPKETWHPVRVNRGAQEATHFDERLRDSGGPQIDTAWSRGMVSGATSLDCINEGTSDSTEMLVGDEGDCSEWKLVAHSNKRKRPVESASGSPVSLESDHRTVLNRKKSDNTTSPAGKKTRAVPDGLTCSGMPKHGAFDTVSSKTSKHLIGPIGSRSFLKKLPDHVEGQERLQPIVASSKSKGLVPLLGMPSKSARIGPPSSLVPLALQLLPGRSTVKGEIGRDIQLSVIAEREVVPGQKPEARKKKKEKKLSSVDDGHMEIGPGELGCTDNLNSLEPLGILLSEVNTQPVMALQDNGGQLDSDRAARTLKKSVGKNVFSDSERQIPEIPGVGTKGMLLTTDHPVNQNTASQVTNKLMQEIKFKSESAKKTILETYQRKYPRLLEYMNVALKCDKEIYVMGSHAHKKLKETIGDVHRIVDPPTRDMRKRVQKLEESGGTSTSNHHPRRHDQGLIPSPLDPDDCSGGIDHEK